jgi:hypothetical protein
MEENKEIPKEEWDKQHTDAPELKPDEIATGPVINDYARIVKTEDGKILYDCLFQKELTTGEIQRNKNHLLNNINKIKDILATFDLDKMKEQETATLAIQREQFREALLHFDKYLADKIKEIRRSKDSKRKEIQEWLQNFDKLLEKHLEACERRMITQKESYERQLDNDTRHLGVYDGY